MDIRFNDDQIEIANQARRFFANECPPDFVREMYEDERGFTDELWTRMTEMGWMGMRIPGDYGGIGLELMDLCIVLEEMGRAVLPGPEGSISKLYHSTLWAKISELAMEIQGPYHQLIKGSPQAIENGDFQTAFLAARGSLIAAGSTEIMKNIIGERVLHLPKDMARAAITKRS